MKLVLASNNKNKIVELDGMLKSENISDAEVLSLKDIGFFDDIEETGSSFEENARIKAKAVAELGYIAIADDSGLCVDALDGAPGVYSARYSGEHGDDNANNEKLLEVMKDIPDGARTAHYISHIVCILPNIGKDISVSGVCNGIILQKPKGNGGFGYDPLFYCPELGKTFAEITLDEKNTVSHRAKAFKLLAEQLKKYI